MCSCVLHQHGGLNSHKGVTVMWLGDCATGNPSHDYAQNERNDPFRYIRDSSIPASNKSRKTNTLLLHIRPSTLQRDLEMSEYHRCACWCCFVADRDVYRRKSSVNIPEDELHNEHSWPSIASKPRKDTRSHHHVIELSRHRVIIHLSAE